MPATGSGFGGRVEATVERASHKCLRVKILRGERNIYPAFDEISPALRKHMTWSKYFDFCGGWHYDRVCGHGEADEYSPDPQVWFGIVCVEAAFADAAVDMFPDTCDIVSEADFEKFHDERAHAHEPAEKINAVILEGIRAKYGITGRLSHDDARITDPLDKQALDPDHPSPGIVKNRKRKFADFKRSRNLKI